VGFERPERTVLFVCADRFGREVVLYEDTWYDHVLSKRHILAGRLAAVEAAIMHAERITHDRKDPDRRCYYRSGELPPPDVDDFVKVVVAFGPRGHDGVVRGVVATAFTTTRVTFGEKREW
jgi:hypothetical protein